MYMEEFQLCFNFKGIRCFDTAKVLVNSLCKNKVEFICGPKIISFVSCEHTAYVFQSCVDYSICTGGTIRFCEIVQM